MKARLISPTGMVGLNGVVDGDKYTTDGQFVVTSDVPTIQKLVEEHGYKFFDVQDDGDHSVEFKLFDFNSGKNDLRVDEIMRNVYLDGYSYIGTKTLKVLLVKHAEPVEVVPIKQRRFTTSQWAAR